ncbi:MAG: hypothetical protein ACE5F4_02955 [Candidatus Paceibacteria bacterium]
MSLTSSYTALLKGGVDPDRVLAYMKTKGHLPLLPRIVSALERAPDSHYRVIVADERAANAARAEHPDAAVSVDSRIVGGTLTRKGTTLTDKTYRRALVRIYQEALHNGQ